MAPNPLFQRIFQWLANEVIVKGLANNKMFQEFAVRSSQSAREAAKTAADAAKSLSENPSVTQMKGETDALRKRAMGFASALREEIKAAADDAARQAGASSAKKPPGSGPKPPPSSS